MSGFNLTSYQGRQCTRVKRAAVVQTSPAANTTTLVASVAVQTAPAASSVATSAQTDVSPSSAAAATSNVLSTPTPGLPPSPSSSESDGIGTLLPQSVNRSMVSLTGEASTNTSTATTGTGTTSLTTATETIRNPSVSLTPAASSSIKPKNTSSPKPAIMPTSTTVGAAASSLVPNVPASSEAAVPATQLQSAAASAIVPVNSSAAVPTAPAGGGQSLASPDPQRSAQTATQASAPTVAVAGGSNSGNGGGTGTGSSTGNDSGSGSGSGTGSGAANGSGSGNANGNGSGSGSGTSNGSGSGSGSGNSNGNGSGGGGGGGAGGAPATGVAPPLSGTTATANAGNAPLQAQPIPIVASGVSAGLATPIAGTITASIIPAQLTTGKPTTAISVVVGTNSVGKPTSFTSTFVITPTVAVIGGGVTEGAGTGAGTSSSHHDGRKVDAGTVIGAVAGVVSFAIIAALILFCGRRWRRRRHRASGTPLLNRNSGRQSKGSLSEKVTGLFGRRGSITAEPTTRIPTPQLERGMRDTSSSHYSNSNRNRSSSVPVTAFRDRALGILSRGRRSRSPHHDTPDTSPDMVETSAQTVPPRITTPIAQHRRSASSVSSFIQAWSADEYNNPFRDPDPSQRLQIVNPDLSRSNTATTIPQLPQAPMPKSMSPAIRSPSRMNIGATASATVAAAVIPAMAIPPKPRHKRSLSQAKIANPFMDPQTTPASPSRSQYRLPEDLVAPEPLAYKPINTYPVDRPLQHQASKSSVDSGFVSAKSPLEEQEEKAPGFRGNSDPLRQWHLSTVLSSEGSQRSSNSALSPFSDSNRLSKLSFLSGPEDASSSVGPTRPVTSAYPSYMLDRNSSASDPFDLDRPEILGLMKPHWTLASRDTSLSRSGSHHSDKSAYSRATTATPIQPLMGMRKNSASPN